MDQAMGSLQWSGAARFSLAAVAVTLTTLWSSSRRASEAASNSDSLSDSSMAIKEADVAPSAWSLASAIGGGCQVGFWYCLGYLCQSYGLQTVAASKSAFFNALAVLVVPVLDSFLRSRSFGADKVLSTVLAVVGVGFLELGAHFDDSTFAAVGMGDVFCLGQAVFFGLGYWLLEDVSSKHSDKAGWVTVGQLVAVAAGFVAYAFGSATVPAWTQVVGWLTNPLVVGAIVWTGLVSTALALYMETVALAGVTATELTLIMTSTSLFGSAFAFLTLGELPAPVQMIGGLLILAGCIVSSRQNEEGSEAP
jgi:drug/metabolite transporter (DMT)-like permease